MKAKKDGRRNNGAESRGLTEDVQLVRGPSVLIVAMRKRARDSGRTIIAVWREAAELYLKSDQGTG